MKLINFYEQILLVRFYVCVTCIYMLCICVCFKVVYMQLIKSAILYIYVRTAGAYAGFY